MLCTELRTPIRDDGGEENEDTMQLAKDIQKVREALQTEGEATSQLRCSSAEAALPASSPEHAGELSKCLSTLSLTGTAVRGRSHQPAGAAALMMQLCLTDRPGTQVLSD